MENLTIAELLRDLRNKKGVNQDEAAEACDISRVALARYETGQRVPRAQIAARLADYYGVTVDYLLGREEQHVPSHEKAPDNMRAEAKKLLESMTDEEYERALAILRALNESKKEKYAK